MSRMTIQQASSEAQRSRALVELGSYLQGQDYRHTVVTPLTHEYNNRRSDGTARTLRDVFGWSRPFPRYLLPARVLELMDTAGVLVTDGHLLRSTVRWATLDDMLCAHSAYPTDATDAVFFGPDTYRFAQVIKSLVQSRGDRLRRAVDIGCGSGAGALLVARHCPTAEVLGVDINPFALHLTRVNAELARIENLRPVQSNLLAEVEGDLDLIVANPPYMLDPQERAYRHGGGTLGAGLSVKIVETALARLAPGGVLLLYTGVAMVNGRDPFLQTLQQRLANQSCHWSYRELDPDVFGEELLKPAYAEVERIAAVALTLEL
jgi:SAM-dependent methyltransferase